MGKFYRQQNPQEQHQEFSMTNKISSNAGSGRQVMNMRQGLKATTMSHLPNSSEFTRQTQTFQNNMPNSMATRAFAMDSYINSNQLPSQMPPSFLRGMPTQITSTVNQTVKQSSLIRINSKQKISEPGRKESSGIGGLTKVAQNPPYQEQIRTFASVESHNKHRSKSKSRQPSGMMPNSNQSDMSLYGQTSAGQSTNTQTVRSRAQTDSTQHKNNSIEPQGKLSMTEGSKAIRGFSGNNHQGGKQKFLNSETPNKNEGMRAQGFFNNQLYQRMEDKEASAVQKLKHAQNTGIGLPEKNLNNLQLHQRKLDSALAQSAINAITSQTGKLQSSNTGLKGMRSGKPMPQIVAGNNGMNYTTSNLQQFDQKSNSYFINNQQQPGGLTGTMPAQIGNSLTKSHDFRSKASPSGSGIIVNSLVAQPVSMLGKGNVATAHEMSLKEQFKISSEYNKLNSQQDGVQKSKAILNSTYMASQTLSGHPQMHQQRHSGMRSGFSTTQKGKELGQKLTDTSMEYNSMSGTGDRSQNLPTFIQNGSNNLGSKAVKPQDGTALVSRQLIHSSNISNSVVTTNK